MTAAELAAAHWAHQRKEALLLSCPHTTNEPEDLPRWHLVRFHRANNPARVLHYIACDDCERRLR
jgi:hypothetical protein